MQLGAARVEVGDGRLELVDRDLPVRVGLADERGPASELERVAAHDVVAHHAVERLRVALVELDRAGVGDLAHSFDAALERGERLGQRLDLGVEIVGLALRGEPPVRGRVDRGTRARDFSGSRLRGDRSRRAREQERDHARERARRE